MRKAAWIFLVVAFGSSILLYSCATQPPPPQPLPEQTAEPAPPQSPLSHGSVTSTVVKGQTTQAKLVELFGGPNIATTDSDGTETWVYEEKSTTSNTQNQAAASSRVDAMALFFGIGGVGSSTGQIRSENIGTTTFSSKSVTFIVKFNPDKTVKDYDIRQTSF